MDTVYYDPHDVNYQLVVPQRQAHLEEYDLYTDTDAWDELVETSLLIHERHHDPVRLKPLDDILERERDWNELWQRLV